MGHAASPRHTLIGHGGRALLDPGQALHHKLRHFFSGKVAVLVNVHTKDLIQACSMVKVVVQRGHWDKRARPVLFDHILDVLGGLKCFLEDQQVVGNCLCDRNDVGEDGRKVQEC